MGNIFRYQKIRNFISETSTDEKQPLSTSSTTVNGANVKVNSPSDINVAEPAFLQNLSDLLYLKQANIPCVYVQQIMQIKQTLI